MKLSEFQRAVADEFGTAYGQVLVRDSVLADLGSRTAEEALEAGVPAGEVWWALCVAQDVPVARRHGVGLPQPKN
jgi:hypothetical protein